MRDVGDISRIATGHPMIYEKATCPMFFNVRDVRLKEMFSNESNGIFVLA